MPESETIPIIMKGVRTMKKTNATLLTAAMFAAAVNLVPGSGAADNAAGGNSTMLTAGAMTTEAPMATYQVVYGPPWSYDNQTEDIDEPEYTTTSPITTEMQTMYGPPWMFGTTTVADPELETTTITMPMTQPLYGPPWMFGTTTAADPQPVVTNDPTPQPAYGPPMLTRGDLTRDGRVNAFDLVAAKQLLVNQDEYDLFDLFNAADFNRDGVISVADLISMNRFLLGDKEGYDENYGEDTPVVTTTNRIVDDDERNNESTTTQTSTYIPDDDRSTTTTGTFAPLYGPPWVFDR